MQLVVLADDILKKELLQNDIHEEVDVVMVQNIEDFIHYKAADGFIDLLFEASQKRIELLKTVASKPIIVNSVILPLKKINAPFIRMNAWPGFLQRPVAEASYIDEEIRLQAEKIFSFFNKKPEWVADEPGFVTARVIAMIINEAYFALEEKISTKEEIDIAMKLGTNYPFGPFEWSRKIGLKNIYTLLNELCKTNARYQPAALLEKEVLM